MTEHDHQIFKHEQNDLAKSFEDHVQEYGRMKLALTYAKHQLKQRGDNLSLEFIRRIEAGEVPELTEGLAKHKV